ncbi:MAG: HD domain-containing protein [Clostridia bacterium]|nr:HD domain-containing protein [Clostridia bacterium]
MTEQELRAFETENKYKVLVAIEDEDELLKVTESLEEIQTADVTGLNDNGEMLTLLANDHTFDILVLKYKNTGDDAFDLVREIRKHNTSIFVVFLVDINDELPSMEILNRFNIQGYCKTDEGFDELKVWIHSGTRILEQTKMLKQLYMQTKKQAETIKRLNTKLTSSYYDTIDTLRKAVDKKDPYTRGHSDRVAYISALIAEELGFSVEEVETIKLGGQFHDIGKIGIKDSILTKPGKLTDEEYEEIKKHPVIGYDLLEKNNVFKDILPAIRHHHERFDGKGYPDGLAGNAIPLMARIVCVADSFDAMMSRRSYRDKMDLEYTMNEIRNNKGTQFDPVAAEAFCSLMETRMDEVIKITNQFLS